MATLIPYLSSALGFAMLLLFTWQLLPSRLCAWKIAALSLALAAFVVLCAQVGLPPSAQRLYPLALLLIALLIPLFFFEGALWRRYAVFVPFMALLALCSAGSEALFSPQSGAAASPFSIVPIFIQHVFTAALYMLFGSTLVLALRMVSAKKLYPHFLLFFILPLGQLILLYSFGFPTWTAWWLVGVLLSLVADLVLLIYTISQEKKTALEQELRETRHLAALEQLHYQGIQQRQKELSKIREDFQRQLANAALLVGSGEGAPAQELIHALSKEISGRKENAYCPIPVVNAILTEKAQECSSAKIGFTVELDIPARLAVEPIHLCSILANLLDNAIHACKQAAGEPAPAIRLSSIIDGDYLFIKVVNPSSEPPLMPLPGRGYGSRILTELAARYGGDYEGRFSGRVFTAVVSLLAVER